jgi:hypothetical protein
MAFQSRIGRWHHSFHSIGQHFLSYNQIVGNFLSPGREKMMPLWVVCYSTMLKIKENWNANVSVAT